MHGARGSGRRKSGRSRLVLGVAILLIIGYGFYVQSRDFHREGGFKSHRKSLRETEQALQKVSKKLQNEAEQLSTASLRNATRLGGSQADTDAQQAALTKAAQGLEDTQAAVSDALQAGIDRLTRRADAADGAAGQGGGGGGGGGGSMQGLVTEQEARVDETTASYHPLPLADLPLASELLAFDVVVEPFGEPGEAWASEAEWRRRQKAVKNATQETWAVYERHTMGADELQPLSLQRKTTFGGMGATLIDSLDTLWMMGLSDEFARAREWVAANLTFSQPAKLSLFETTIRIVGGLLSAYDLTDDRLFLDKASALVDMLMPVFGATQSGIPNNIVFINQGEDKHVRASQLGRAAIAEFGTLQVEFLVLSQRTGNASYGDKAEAILDRLHETYKDKGLLPVWYNRRTGKASGSNLYTVGAMADSYFEYLLKLWLLHGKQVDAYRSRWERATDEAFRDLVAVSGEGLTFVGSKRSVGKLVAKMEHLACYFPGNLALGVWAGAVTGPKAQHYIAVAANLTYTCWQMYERTKTGLGMDHVVFDDKNGMVPKGAMNMLRPEAIESLFYMWRVTRQPKYREWGWKMFAAFRNHSRTAEGAFACVADVNEVPVRQQDGMETFWLAETLKYLWLLFGPDDLLSLEKYVLNTEAHPLLVKPLLRHPPPPPPPPPPDAGLQGQSL